MLRLLIVTALAGALLATPPAQATFSRATALTTAPPSTPIALTLSEPEVAARVAPSVVQVLTDDEAAERGAPGVAEGRASGVKVAEGIVTNDHVVGDAERVHVVTSDGRRGTAVVVSRAAALDLVLLRTDLDLPAIALEGVKEQRQGETVLVLGYPRPDALGPGEDVTLTRGLISAIRRDHEGVTYIQTDATMNPGSSGGAVVNLRGNLIGIPTVGVRGSESLNLAVSADGVQALLQVAPPGAAPAGPLYRGDPREVLLTPDDLGPEWGATRGALPVARGRGDGTEAIRRSAEAELVRGDPMGRGRGSAALLSMARVQDDAQRAQLFWERTIRHAPGGLTRLPDPNVADACRAYTRAKGGLAELHILCREGNVVVAVVMQGPKNLATYDALAFYTGIMTERVRKGST
jgi:hypothetical protein